VPKPQYGKQPPLDDGLPELSPFNAYYRARLVEEIARALGARAV
jgi:hypothetical protein